MTDFPRGKTGAPPSAPSPAELRELLRRAREEDAASKAELRESRAEGYRATIWWAAERKRLEVELDGRIRAALEAGTAIRTICRDLKVGPNRVCRLRARLAAAPPTGPAADAAGPAGLPPRAYAHSSRVVPGHLGTENRQ